MISIRDYRDDDYSALLELANNTNVARYMALHFPSPYIAEDAKWWIAVGCKEGVTKAIDYNGEFAGSVGAVPRDGVHARTAFAGYWLGEKYWGKGIACEAFKQLTELVFSSTDIVRLEAAIYSPNKASMRVAEKSGYKREATLEKSIYKNSEFYDEIIYSKLKLD